MTLGTIPQTLTTTHTNGNGKASALDYESFDVPPAPEPPTNGAAGKALRKHFELIPAGDLANLPVIRYLDTGAQIPEQSLTMVYGPSGAGKSFYVLDQALRIAQHSPVAYLAGEGARGFAKRQEVWCKHFGLSTGHLQYINRPANLLEPSEVAELIEILGPLSPKLVAIDTLARSMRGDENSARDMGAFVASCDMIREATGAACLVVHHTNKNGTAERGSSSLRAAADQVISISNDDGLIRISCDKSKDDAEFKTYGMRLVVLETGRMLEDGKKETSCVLLPAGEVLTTGIVTKGQRAILEAMALEVFAEAGATARQLMATVGMPEPSLYRALSKLKRGEYLSQGVKGDPYRITERGTRLLDTSLGL